MRILKENTNLSLFRVIISIFLMTEFSKLESIYSNGSEIFPVYFWDIFRYSSFLSTIHIYF